MDRDELVFVLRAIAEDVEKGFKQAEQAADSLGESYEGLTEAEKRMHEANDDLKKRLEALKTGMKGVNVESAKMPKEIRQVSSAFRAAASGAGAFAVAMIGIQLVAGLITKIAEAAKKAKEELAKLNEEANKMAQQTGGMAFLVNRYEELAKQVTRSKEETAQMEGISRTLVDTYGMRADGIDAEGRAIVVSLELMREQLEIQRKLTILKLEEAEAGNESGLAKALKAVADEAQYLDGIKERIDEIKAELETAYDATDRAAAGHRGNLIRNLEMLERSYADMDKAAMEGNLAVMDQLTQSMSLALLKLKDEVGEEAAQIPPHIQAKVLESIRATGDVFNWQTFMGEFKKYLKDGIKPAEGAGEAIKLTTEQIERMAAKAKAAKTDLKGMTSSVQGLDNSTASLKKEIQDLNDLQTAINVLKEGDTASTDFGLALDYLAERYGVAADQVMDNLEAYQRDADIKATLLELNLLLAEQEAITAKQTAVAMAQAGDITVYQASRMIAALDDVILKLRELSGDDSGTSGISLKTVGVSMPASWRTGKSTKSTGGGSTKAQAYKNPALEKELALIERKKRLDQITADEEIAMLVRAKNMHAKTAEERQSLDEKIYGLRKTKRQADFEHAKKMGELTLADEVAYWEETVKQYKKGTDERLNAEEQLYAAKEALRKEEEAGLAEMTEAERRAYEANLNNKRREFDHKKAMDQTTLQDEIAFWEDMVALTIDGSDERLEAEEQLYDAKKRLRDQERADADREFSHRKAMGETTLEDEIAFWQKKARLAEDGSEEQMRAIETVHNLERQALRDAYDAEVYYGRLSLEQRREWIKGVLATLKEGTDEYEAWLRMLFDNDQALMDRDVQALDKLGQGVITALRARYAAHREEELSALQASMDAWGDWADVQVDAINAQIRALDDLTKQEDRGDEETRRRRKIAALEQQLLYETDEYNRRKLEEQLTREKDDLSKWQTRNEREDQKEALRDQATHVQERARQEQGALRDQMDAVNKFYDERLQAQNLAAEAEYVLMEGTQDDIIELLKSYAPEYDATGKTLGQKLYDGFMAKAGGIADYIGDINAQLDAAQASAAQLATQTAVEFWNTQGAPVVTCAGGTTKTTSNAVTINVLGSDQSPASLAREMERTLDRLSRV